MKSIAIAAATAFACILGTQGVSAATQNVNNVNDPINRPYQQYTYNNCGYTVCSLSFGTITAPETVVEHVSCAFNIAAGGFVSNLEVYDKTNPNNANFLPVSSNGSDGAFSYYAINGDTKVFLTTGAQPGVYISANSTIYQASCAISGYHR